MVECLSLKGKALGLELLCQNKISKHQDKTSKQRAKTNQKKKETNKRSSTTREAETRGYCLPPWFGYCPMFLDRLRSYSKINREMPNDFSLLKSKTHNV